MGHPVTPQKRSIYQCPISQSNPFYVWSTLANLGIIGDSYGPETPPQKMVQTSPPSSAGNEITDWRHCQSVQDLTKHLLLEDTVIRNLQTSLKESDAASFPEFLIEDVEDYICTLFGYLQSQKIQGINYSPVPARNPHEMDTTIGVCLQLIGISRTRSRGELRKKSQFLK